MRRIAMVVAALVAAALATLVGAGTAQAAPALYTIDVKTCDLPNAGTDSDLQAKLVGTAGETTWVVLDNDGDDRERNKVDRYQFTLPDVGQVTAIKLAFNDAGDNDWCLSDILVFGPHGRTDHPYYNWLTKKVEFYIFAA